jgi:hypothetical protein
MLQTLYVGEYLCFTIGGITFRLIKKCCYWSVLFALNQLVFFQPLPVLKVQCPVWYSNPAPFLFGKVLRDVSSVFFVPLLYFPPLLPEFFRGQQPALTQGLFTHQGGRGFFSPLRKGGRCVVLRKQPQKPSYGLCLFCSRTRHCVCFTVVFLIT